MVKQIMYPVYKMTVTEAFLLYFVIKDTNHGQTTT